MRDRGRAGDQTFGGRASGGASDVAPVPGRQSLVQLSMAPAEASPEPQPAPAEPSAPMAQLPSYASICRLFGNRVQAKAAAAPGPADVHAAAAQGISGASSSLPHLDQIQRSFGRHDVSHVQAHTGTEAKAGAQAMGADAFATGDHVAFANSPSLHISAHEAAHVVQQRGGVQLAGGVGAVGDAYEQHADQVADLVVQGKSAEALLDHHAGGGAASAPVQRQQGDPGGPAPGHVAEVRAKLATARAILGDKNAPIGEGERKELEAAVRSAEAALLGYDDLAGRGHARAAAMGPLALAGGGILADDATGVGVADDPALIFIGIGILAALLLTQAPASDRQLAQAWSKVAASLKAVAAAGEVLVALRIKGPQLVGNTGQLAAHLARILALGSVGGVPSGEPPKNNNDNDQHWWKEIKAFLKNVGSAIRGASRKQVLRELSKEFTEEQILEIERRLVEAAARMGEPPPPFLPPP